MTISAGLDEQHAPCHYQIWDLDMTTDGFTRVAVARHHLWKKLFVNGVVAQASYRSVGLPDQSQHTHCTCRVPHLAIHRYCAVNTSACATCLPPPGMPGEMV